MQMQLAFEVVGHEGRAAPAPPSTRVLYTMCRRSVGSSVHTDVAGGAPFDPRVHGDSGGGFMTPQEAVLYERFASEAVRPRPAPFVTAHAASSDGPNARSAAGAPLPPLPPPYTTGGRGGPTLLLVDPNPVRGGGAVRRGPPFAGQHGLGHDEANPPRPRAGCRCELQAISSAPWVYLSHHI